MNIEEAMVHRGITLRVRPGSRAKHNKLMRICGACRKVWNEGLEICARQWQEFKAGKGDKPNVTHFGLNNLYVQIKRELPWLGELPSHTVRYTMTYTAKIDPKYTSQRCHNCGVVRKANRKSPSVYHCGECDVEKNADVNAALNIRDKWLGKNMASGDGATAGGDCNTSWSVKPENVYGKASRPTGAVWVRI